jgi:hypothetical protein
MLFAFYDPKLHSDERPSAPGRHLLSAHAFLRGSMLLHEEAIDSFGKVCIECVASTLGSTRSNLIDSHGLLMVIYDEAACVQGGHSCC